MFDSSGVVVPQTHQKKKIKFQVVSGFLSCGNFDNFKTSWLQTLISTRCVSMYVHLWYP